MEYLSSIAVVLATFAGLVVGLRLLWAARKTGGLPELFLGSTLFIGGFVGNGFRLLAFRVAAEGGAPLLFGTLSRVAFTCGALCMALAAWRIFRPQSRGAALLVAVLAVGLIPYLLRDVLLRGVPPTELINYPLFWIGAIDRMTCYGWMAWESLRIQLKLRRQNRIGIGNDPVLANQSLLWGLGNAATTLMLATLFLNLFLTARFGLRIPNDLLIGVFGLFSTTAIWFAFFLPASYVRRLERQKPAMANGGP